MSIRFYVAPEIEIERPPGSGHMMLANRVYLYITPGTAHAISVAKAFPWKSWSLARVEVDDALHATIQTDAEITLVPLFTDTGDYLENLSSTISQVSADNRQVMASWLENQRIPVPASIGAWTIGQFIAFIVRLFNIAKRLQDNFPELDLTSTVKDIPGPQRTRMQQWMEDHGVDTQWITLNTSIRTLLQYMIDNFPWRPTDAELGTPLL